MKQYELVHRWLELSDKANEIGFTIFASDMSFTIVKDDSYNSEGFESIHCKSLNDVQSFLLGYKMGLENK